MLFLFLGLEPASFDGVSAPELSPELFSLDSSLLDSSMASVPSGSCDSIIFSIILSTI